MLDFVGSSSRSLSSSRLTSSMSDIFQLVQTLFFCITSFSSAQKKITPVFNRFYQELTEASEAIQNSTDTELGNCDGSTVLKAKLQRLIEEKNAIEHRLFVLEGDSLRDTISERIDRKKYEDNLGIVHKVQKDLEMISDAMLIPKKTRKVAGKESDDNKSNKEANNEGDKERNKKNVKENVEELFPRGKPRIILFVDDLDRCPQDTVVEVIEALQLLVKTNLFVAVVGIDPRYVTLSLEKNYEGILDPHTPPSGMDFLEKIIQIPFRLPGMDDSCMSKFLKDQIDVKESNKSAISTEISQEQQNTKAKEEQQNTKAKEEQQKTKPKEEQQKTKPKEEQQNRKPKEEQQTKAKDEDDDLPASKVPLSQEESKMVEETLQLFRVGPRCIKRIINVFKILMVIWKRDKDTDFEHKRAILFLMLMASDESTREVTYKIFNWMEMGMVTYHQVARVTIQKAGQSVRVQR